MAPQTDPHIAWAHKYGLRGAKQVLVGLSDAAIRKLKAKTDRYEVTDREGLYIEVQPSGRLVWRYRYRLNGKREKYSIGPYPAIGLHDARTRRLAAERLVLEGKSPAQLKQLERKALKAGSGKKLRTFSELSSAWIANDCTRRRRIRS